MATGQSEFAAEVSDFEKELKAAEADAIPERTSIEDSRRAWSKEFRALLEQMHRIEESFPTGLPAGSSAQIVNHLNCLRVCFLEVNFLSQELHDESTVFRFGCGKRFGPGDDLRRPG